MSLIILIVNWLAEGNFEEKFRKFSDNKPAVAFTLIYGLSVLGLLWSKDIRFAFYNDLLHKSPTLFMPIVIVTSPALNLKRIRLLLILFISSVFVVSLIGLSIRLFHPGASFRDASPFMPGVYLGMMLILAAFQLPLLIREITNKKVWFFITLIISGWLIFFLFYLRAMSGIASFAGVWFFLIALLVRRQKGIFFRISVLTIFLLTAGFSIWILSDIYKKSNYEVKTDLATLQQYTVAGNKYYHDTTNILRENGNLVYIYISEEELRDEWKAKSKLDFYGHDLANNLLRHTLYRYMSSMGLRKDKQNFILLKDSDIRAIEKGITNHFYLEWPGVYIRVFEEMRGIYIYRKSMYRIASGFSFAERIDQWRASWQSFREHPLLGWGTGSVFQATDWGFKKNGSPLVGRNMRPHNQYICYLLTTGVFGLVVFLMLYIFIVLETRGYKALMFKIFLIVFAINFLANNSLENQLGQNLFVFFSIIYCFLYPQVRAE